jgi:uncharacterized BrkB/YihY/UPF0761 family membrane protein
MQELQVTARRTAMVLWSMVWRSLVLIFFFALCWKLIMNRRTDPIETRIWYAFTYVLWFIGSWWGLRRGSWSEFRIALIKRGTG